jgi:hypothetical protein
MIQALLVDLDDTLLENDLGRFLPAYFDLLAGELSWPNTTFGVRRRSALNRGRPTRMSLFG